MEELMTSDVQTRLAENDKIVYLDVRSQTEFEEGHVPGAINIPVFDMTPHGQLAPNPEFAAVVQATVPKDAEIIVGCRSGQRSAMAAEAMGEMGYGSVTNHLGGFAGRGSMTGEIIDPGWLGSGYPVSRDPEAGKDYPSLREKAAARGT